jgi:fucose 4-O-acetylase-like acetyltransferase
MDGGRTLRETLHGSLDPFKGLLILIVVLDHNNEAHALIHDFMAPLTFHVLGFLLLPFLVRGARLSTEFALDRFLRYWIPQAFIVTLASILYWMLHRRSEPLARVALDYGAALAIGSAPLVKQSTGFLAYWFLPTLLGVVIVLAAYRSVPAGWRWPIIAIFALCHLLLTERNFPGYFWVPFGLAIVANIFVLGLLLEVITRSRTAFALRWWFPAAFVASYGLLMTQHRWLEVATLEFASLSQFPILVEQDVAGLSGVLTVLLLGGMLANNRIMASLGRHSLMIYLLHPLAYAALASAQSAGGLGTMQEPSVVNGVFSYCFALSVSWGVSALLRRSRLFREWVTPRGWRVWGLLVAIRAIRAGRPLSKSQHLR